MLSELPLKAGHQNSLMANRRPLRQPNRHCQGRQELYWHNCAQVTAELVHEKNRPDSTQTLPQS